MSDKKPAGVRVKAKPEINTWPARNAEKHFGLEVGACRKLKAGEAVYVSRDTFDKLTEANLVQACPNKGDK